MSNYTPPSTDGQGFSGVELDVANDSDGSSRHVRLSCVELNGEARRNIAGELTSFAGSVVITFHNWTGWPAEARSGLCELVTPLGSRVSFAVGAQRYTDLLSAAMAMIAPPDHLIQHAASFDACMEIASLLYSGVPEVAAGLIQDRLKELNVRGTRLSNLISRIRGSASDENTSDEITYEAIARRFIAEYRIEVNVPDTQLPVVAVHRGSFYLWKGRAWEEVEDRRLTLLIAKHLQEQEALSVTERVVNNIKLNLQALTLIDDWKTDAPFHIESVEPLTLRSSRRIVLSNGVLDIDDIVAGNEPVLHPHDSRYFNAVALDYDFDAAATCPGWRNFLDTVLPRTDADDHRQEILQEFAGYTFLPACSFQKMLLLPGRGRNGKSVHLDVWEALLGRANVSHTEYSQLCGEFRLSALIGKLANFSSEIDHLGRLREGTLKQLIAGEPVDINRKFRDPISVRLFAKLVAACNELPLISDTSLGFWRRLLIVPFDVVIPIDAVNTNLATELKQELSGILNWAIEGLRRLLTNDGFSECSICRAALDDHRVESDSVSAFIDQFCIVDADAECDRNQFFQLLNAVTVDLGGTTMFANRLGMKLKALGYESRRLGTGGRPRTLLGLRLNVAGQARLDELFRQNRLPFRDIRIRPSCVQPAEDNLDATGTNE